MKTTLFYYIYFCLCVVLTISSVFCDNIQNEMLCADPDCTEPISYAIAKITYNHLKKHHMSFRKGERMAILQKPIPEDKNWGFWYACIIEPTDKDIIKIDVNKNSSRSGLVPESLINEFKLFHKNDALLRVKANTGRKQVVPKLEKTSTEESSQVLSVAGGVAAEIGDRGPPSTPFDVVDGTTIFELLGGETYIKSTETQKNIPETSIPTVALDPSKTQIVSSTTGTESLPFNIETIDNVDDEDDIEGDEEDEEDDEDDETEETETEEVVEPKDSPSQDSVVQPESINLTPTQVSRESRPNIETTEMPKVDFPIDTNLLNENTEKIIDLKPDLMSSFMALETALNSEPGRSAENDEMILKQFSSIPPVTTETVFQSPPHIVADNSKLPETSDSMIKSNLDNISTGDSSEEAPLSSNESISENHFNVTDNFIVNGNVSEFVDHNDNASLSDQLSFSNEVLENAENVLNINIQPTQIDSSTEIKTETESINSEAHLPSDEFGSAKIDTPEQLSEPEINKEVIEDVSEQASSSNEEVVMETPKILEDEKPEPDLNNLNVPDQPIVMSTEEKVNAVPPNVEEISLTPNIPTADTITEYPQIVKSPPIFNAGQMYPGLIPKPVPPAENLIDSAILPSADVDVKPSQEQLSLEQDTEVHEKDITDNEPPFREIPTEIIQESHPDDNVNDSKMYENKVKDNIPQDSPAGVAFIEELTPQFPERNAIEEDIVEPSAGVLRSITGLFSGLFDSNSQTSDQEIVPLAEEIPLPSIPEVAPQESEAVPDGECKTVSGLESECSDEPSPLHLLHFFEKTVPPTSYTALYLIVTSITVLVFTLGYYFIERTRRDGPLVAKVNQLTHELQVATSQLQNRSVSNNGEHTMPSIEVAELKRMKDELELQVETLQLELDSATEAGLELNKMVSDLLAQQQGSGAVLKSVEQLQGQLNGQQLVIDNMNRSLLEKSEENKILQNNLLVAQEKVESLEEKLIEMRETIDQLVKDKENAVWELESKNTKLESDLVALAVAKNNELVELTEKKTNEISELTSTLDDVNKRLIKRESEFHALDATIQQLQSQSQIDVKAIYDIGLITAELQRTRTEKETLQERLQDEEGARKLLEDHAKKVYEEVSELRSSFQTAEKDKNDAETRLTVLSKYFKEKEAHLQKELGLQEAMWVQKQGDDTTVYERMKSLQEEADNYNFDSLQNSNEGLSVTNSLSSMCTDPLSSISNFPSLSISQECIDSQSRRSFDSPEQRSLPIPPVPKARFLKRRKSSADFEARLGWVESMISQKSPSITRDMPEDLLKLQELKTVKASPFKDSSLSSEPFSETSTSFSNVVEPYAGSFSKLIDKFELIKLTSGGKESIDSNVSLPSSSDYSLTTLKCEEQNPNFSLIIDKFVNPDNTNPNTQVKSNNQTDGLNKIGETGIKCSELVDKFENIKNNSQFSNSLVISPLLNRLESSRIKVKESATKGVDSFPNQTSKEEDKIKDDLVGLLCFPSHKSMPIESLQNRDLYSSLEPAVEPAESSEVVLQTKSPRVHRISQSDKSESEDSQSINKECDLSTATLEFDIKVVANAMSNVKKIKKRSTRQKIGAQNEGLKKEIIDQERGFKGRIASLEKKAHDSWVAARQAERRLEESKQEAGQLRNMITLIEKSNVTETDGKLTPRHTTGDLNGDSLPPLLPGGVSPLPLPPLNPAMLPPGFMPPFMPPPIEGFMPPPPFLPGDHRPPPLGRMSSPPLNRYSPSPVDYSYDRLSSPPPLSPPDRDYRSPPADPDRFHRSPLSPWQELSPRSSFRPVTSHRDSQKSYQDSNHSSVHSSSESLHKPTKRIEKYSKPGHSKK